MVASALANWFKLNGLNERMRSAVSRFYKQKILFFHVPKCGGTSFSQVMRLHFFLSCAKISEDSGGDAFKQQYRCNHTLSDDFVSKKQWLMLYFINEGVHFIHAHAPYAPAMFNKAAQDYKFVTMLREPVDRLKSIYFFDPCSKEMSFQEFLNSPRGDVECSIYMRYFGGLPFEEPAPSQNNVRQAIEALETFSVVGLLENMEAFSKAVKDEFGIPIKVPKRNIGERRQHLEEAISAALEQEMRERCALDFEIYNHFAHPAAASIASTTTDGAAAPVSSVMSN